MTAAEAADRPAALPDPARVRKTALRYLRDGRVVITSAGTPAGEQRPYEVTAYVQGHDRVHTVRLEHGAWSCSCLIAGCGHRAATALDCGWPSAASKGGA